MLVFTCWSTVDNTKLGRRMIPARHPILIVGAGVAGSSLACELARAGCAVQLVDRARFPRPKVCGGCLSPRSVAALGRLDVEVGTLGARPISNFVLRADGRATAFALAPVAGHAPAAVSRSTLDEALVRRAAVAGADVREGVEVLGSERRSDHRLARARSVATGAEMELPADVVIAADGIGSVLARDAGLPEPAARERVVGAANVLDATAFDSPPDDRAVTMIAGPEGYCGLVRIEDGRWNAAACLRADWLHRSRSSPGDAMASLLEREGILLSPAGRAALSSARACPPLRRSVRRPWADRLLLVGDAAGYHEPITGEGMAWALEGASRLTALVRGGWCEASGPRWEREWRSVVGRRLVVRLAAFALSRPAVRRLAMMGLAASPASGSAIAACVARPRALAGGAS